MTIHTIYLEIHDMVHIIIKYSLSICLFYHIDFLSYDTVIFSVGRALP